MPAIAIGGIGPDAQRVHHVKVQRGDGNAGACHLRVVVEIHIAPGIADTDVEVIHIAFDIPVEDDIAAGAAGLGDVVDAAILVVIVFHIDVGIADIGGLHVFRCVVGEQQHLGAHGGYAGGLQADLSLEQGHGLLGLAAEVAVDGAVVVSQFHQAALQAGDALVAVASAKHDVAGGLGGLVGEQQPLHGRAGMAGLPQARRPLEYAHRRCSLGGVGAAGAAFQIVQVPQAVVQLAHAIAGVAGIQIDIAGAVGRPVGVEALQCLPSGGGGLRQSVFILEQLNGLQCAGPEDAIRRVGQVAQLAQALLHLAHAHTAAAPGQLAVGVVGAQLAGEDDPLKLGVGHAGHGTAKVGLQQLHGRLGAGPVDAVHIVIVVAQVLQGLLNGAHGVAAAAPGQGGVLGGGLQPIPRGLLALQLEGVDQAQHGRGGVGLRFELDEREGGLGGLVRQLGVYVQLAAHALDAQAVHVVFRGQLVSRQIGIALEHTQRALVDVHAAHGVVGGQHEQRLAAGSQLILHLHAGGQHDLRGLRAGVVGLQPKGTAGAGDIIQGVVQPGEGGHVGVDQAGGVVEAALQVQLRAIGQVGLVAFAGRTAAGHATVVDFKAARICHVQHRACSIHQLDDQSFRRHVQPVDGLCGGVDHLARQTVQVDAVQLGALGAGHIVGGVVVGQAGSLDIGGNQGFFKALQVDHVKILAVQEFVRAQIEHAVGVDAQDVVRRLDVDGLRPSGQVEMPLAVDVGGKGIAAGDGFALRHRKGGGEQAQRQQHD